MYLADEFLDHLLGDFEIGNDAIAQRPDGLDIARCTAKHLLGFVADGKHAFLALGLDDRDDRRLVEDDVTTLDVDQRVRGPEVDGHICG